MSDPGPFPITDFLPSRLPPEYKPTPITSTSPTGPLKRYYFNARGVNFVPEGYDLFPFGKRPWGEFTGDDGFSGINNPMCLFKFFDAQAIDEQLGYIRGIGCNFVRIWVGYYAWRHYKALNQENIYLSKLGILQSLLHKHKLHVIWTFWDDIPPVPNSSFPTELSRWSAVNEWVQTPYYPDKNTDFLTSIGFSFLSAVVPVLASSQATVGYETGNELNVVKTVYVSSFVASSIKKIYELDPNPRHPISVGTVALTPYETTLNASWPAQKYLFTLPEVKLFTFHPYYVISSVLEKFMYLAVSASQKYGKPILITEGAFTLGLQPWGRFIQEFTPCAVGFTLYTGMIGCASSNVPYKESTGLFHADGEVRDLRDAMAMYNLGLSSSDRYRYQLDYPKLKVDYPVNESGIANRFEAIMGGPKTISEGQSYIASGYDVEDVLYMLARWDNRTFLSSLSGAGNTAIVNELLKQTEILNIFNGDFTLMSNKILGTFGTSEAYSWMTDAEDANFTSSISQSFNQIAPIGCVFANTCLTSTDPWYFNLSAYDTSYGVMGRFFSGVLKGKNYF